MAAHVTLIGHVTRDVIRFPARPERRQPGGAVYYAGMALRALGDPVRIVTRVAACDADDLLGALIGAGADVYNIACARSTCFVNTHCFDDPDDRTQQVTALAAPFAADTVPRIEGQAVYFGPLTAADIPARVICSIAANCDATMVLDVQGLVRKVVGNGICPADWPEKSRILPLMHIVKADALEAEILTGQSDPEKAARVLADMGVPHVLITMGGGGSVLCHDGTVARLPAWRPKNVASPIIDPTGCGDTFLAAYLHWHMQGFDAISAARFAATAATLKFGHHDPLTESEEMVVRAAEQD